ncbi:MAG: transcriptional regulator NrdR [Thermoleophilaceae bacterium]
MQCPYCSSLRSRVLETRATDPGDAIRRRRECDACGQRFTTYERAEGLRLFVVKRDGRREAFDRDKLLRGLQRAAAKRPIEPERLERLVDAIQAAVRSRGGEAEAEWVGELALGGLARLDRVAAVMFASVYRSIEDLSAFEAELRRLESEPVAGPDQLAIDLVQDGPVPSAQKSTLATPSSGRSKGRSTPRQRNRRPHASHS